MPALTRVAPEVSTKEARYHAATVRSLVGGRVAGGLAIWTGWRLPRVKARLQGLAAPILSSRRRDTGLSCDWSSDVCSSDLSVSIRDGESIPSLRGRVVSFGWKYDFS